MNVDVVNETAPKRNDLFISSLRGLGWGAECIVTNQRTDTAAHLFSVAFARNSEG